MPTLRSSAREPISGRNVFHFGGHGEPKQKFNPVIAQRVSGYVMWYNPPRGYGFIRRIDNREPVFIHVSQINMPKRILFTHQYVEFNIRIDRKGISAVDLESFNRYDYSPERSSRYRARSRSRTPSSCSSYSSSSRSSASSTSSSYPPSSSSSSHAPRAATRPAPSSALPSSLASSSSSSSAFAVASSSSSSSSTSGSTSLTGTASKIIDACLLQSITKETVQSFFKQKPGDTKGVSASDALTAALAASLLASVTDKKPVSQAAKSSEARAPTTNVVVVKSEPVAPCSFPLASSASLATAVPTVKPILSSTAAVTTQKPVAQPLPAKTLTQASSSSVITTSSVAPQSTAPNTAPAVAVKPTASAEAQKQPAPPVPQVSSSSATKASSSSATVITPSTSSAAPQTTTASNSASAQAKPTAGAASQVTQKQPAQPIPGNPTAQASASSGASAFVAQIKGEPVIPEPSVSQPARASRWDIMPEAANQPSATQSGIIPKVAAFKIQKATAKSSVASAASASAACAQVTLPVKTEPSVQEPADGSEPGVKIMTRSRAKGGKKENDSFNMKDVAAAVPVLEKAPRTKRKKSPPPLIVIKSEPVDETEIVEIVDPNCKLCDEELATITFHPCGHKICCLNCSIRIKRCVRCNKKIESKTKPDGLKMDLPKEMGCYMELVNKVSAQEEAQICSICMDKKKSIVFNCGHLACADCAKSIQKCHMCVKPIVMRTKIYEF